MKSKITEYREVFTNKDFLISLLLSLIFLASTIVINFYAGTYAASVASNSVTDIILSNIKYYDVHYLFINGSILFTIFVIFVYLQKPERIPFTVKTTALFVLIRSLFIILTHIGPFAEQQIIYQGFFSKLSFGADLFFSGHTGMPFLFALVFWKDKIIRYIFITFSLSFAVIVLMAHIHYSIDVFSAFFITYTIFHLSEKIFHKDRKMFYELGVEKPIIDIKIKVN